MDSSGAHPMQGSAGRVVLNFTGNNVLATVLTQENVKLVQHQQAAKASSGSHEGGSHEGGGHDAEAQEVEVTASVIDFLVAGGRQLRRADTSGAAQIAIRPTTATAGQTLITAGKFQARFDDLGQLASVHGAPEARIMSQTPGQPDRVSTSTMLVEAGGRVRLGSEPPDNGLRPSVTSLFRSVADVYGKAAVGVLLTGMGRDGVDELRLLKEKGAVTIVQDKASSVIYGMPGEAVLTGAATYELSPDKIVAMLERLTKNPAPVLSGNR
jgi:hypothetical protein